MENLFPHILIPVDFSPKADIAIKKAVGIAGQDATELHLLHVIHSGRGPEHAFKLWAVEKEFEQLRHKIREKYPSARVKTHVLQGGSVEKMIVECVRMLKPALVVLAKADPPRRWSLSRGVSPGIIAKQSNCPVLTVKPGAAGKTRLILVPIRDFLPERKLEWAVALARKYRAQVHLLVFQDRQADRASTLPPIFLKAYNRLQEKLQQPIEFSATVLQDTAKATLHCAETIMADMILVNPKTESGTSGFSGHRHISDLLPPDSKIQVLDVEPYKELSR
ncbi:MAG TPA: universal stress protein [Puia sp.]|uniref:universal stress protein n=1 Tax=Puia sp. TaxID=2045100 RepID=UPI002CCC1684|nr:universal stress protein [Puia sp.]HVU94245.1 universal stress protein [Puia sp.]